MSVSTAYLPEVLLVVEQRCDGLVGVGGVEGVACHRLRIPHATVLCLFTMCGKILVHTRSENSSCPNTLDCQGGHIGYNPYAICDPRYLRLAIDEGAARESCEEVAIVENGEPKRLETRQIVRFSDYGELRADEPANVEFSTGYLCMLQNGSEVCVADDTDDGAIETLAHQWFSLDELVDLYKQDPARFADGLARILERMTRPNDPIRQRIIGIMAELSVT